MSWIDTIPDSYRRRIAAAIMARLDLVTELEYKAFDTVRLASDDFNDGELPAAQCIDLGDINTHEMSRISKEWQIAIELIVGPGAQEEPTQADLWDLMEKVERTLWGKPNLGIAGVKQMKLLATSTDLHFMKPFYVGRIELAVEYYQPLVDDCASGV